MRYAQPRPEYAVPGRTAGAVDYLRREARNRSLGDAGEALVMDYERLRLEHAGKDQLAQNIEQVSKTVGDHAGYDIRSYHADGRDRFIEVKTTRYGRYTPFYHQRWRAPVFKDACPLLSPLPRLRV